MYFDTDEPELIWDEEAKTVSLNLRLKTATALVAATLLVATPANAQVVVGRAGGGPDVQVVAPPRTSLPPEWLSHVPKSSGHAPYQPSRLKPQSSLSAAPMAAPTIAPNYTAPRPLPIAPSPSYNTAPMRAPRIAPTKPEYAPAPRAGAATSESSLMAAPWSPRSQHIDRPLFPELAPKPTPLQRQQAAGNGAVLAAPQLGGTKPVTTRENTTLPPVLTPDLMGSLRQAARDEANGVPPVPAGLTEGNGVNASSAQDRIQTLGTIERSRVDAIVAEREAREGKSPSTRRLFGAPDNAPAPVRDNNDIPVPPAPVPTPVPSTMGYLTPPRGREDDVTVPDKPYASDSLAPLDKTVAPDDEVRVNVEDAPPVDSGNRRVLGRVGDTQKATVYNTPVPVPMDNVAPAAPMPDVQDMVDAAPQDDKAFKAEGRKLFSAKKKKVDKKAAAAADAAKQMSLFDEAQAGAAVTAPDGSNILKVPTAPVAPDAVVTDGRANTLLTITPQGSEEAPRAIAAAGAPATDTTTTTMVDGAKEVKEVPINPTPFGDKVLGTITPQGASTTAVADTPVATGADGVPDITTASEAPKVLTKATRKKVVAAPKPAPAPEPEVVPEPEPTPAPAADIVAVPPKPADDEIRVVVDDEPVAAPKPAPARAPGPEAVIAPSEAPKNVLRAPVAVIEQPAPRPAAPIAKPAPRIEPEAYVPPPQALRRQPVPQPAPQPAPEPQQQMPTSLAPMDEAPAAPVQRAPEPAPTYTPPVYAAPRVQQEQMYVQTPAPQQGERPRLRTPKLLLGSDLPAATAPAAAAPIAEITPQAAIEPTVIERPALTPPPEPEIAPTYIAPPAAEVELRMPTVTFGPTDRELDQQGETQVDLLAEQMAANPGRRLTLIAYAQAPNLNESRRVALSRALAIRSRLAEYGIQPIRVSIRALGALPPGDRGTPDRVDTIIQ